MIRVIDGRGFCCDTQHSVFKGSRKWTLPLCDSNPSGLFTWRDHWRKTSGLAVLKFCILVMIIPSDTVLAFEKGVLVSARHGSDSEKRG
jgi:hypothetical protein